MSGLPKRRTTKAKPQPQSEDEGGISLVALYVGAAIVGGVLIAGVTFYLVLPSATQFASATAEGVLKPANVADSAHDLIVGSINLEIGENNWRELEFKGPIPAEPLRQALIDQLAGQPAAQKYENPDAWACVARMLINVKP